MNINYNKKYLKYKKKYLELKGGSALVDHNKPIRKHNEPIRQRNEPIRQRNEPIREYNIYTTGIAEWGQLENMFKYWNDTLCTKICSCIPPSFNAINIIHCDTLVQVSDEDKPIIIRKINDNLWNIANRNLRIRNIIFQTTPLNFEKIKIDNIPYLIADLAHIFSYTGINDYHNPRGSTEVYISGHYGESEGSRIFLNIFYPDYVGQEQRDTDLFITSREIIECDTNIIQINDDGLFRSIINFLSNKSRFKEFDNNYPLTRIRSIIKQIKSRLQTKFKNEFGNYDQFDIKYNSLNEACIQRYQQMLKFIIKLIMETDLEEDIIVEIVFQETNK